MSRIDEAISFSQLDSLSMNKITSPKDRTLFRMIFKADIKKMFISIFETQGKNWEFEKKMEINQYINDELLQNTGELRNRVFLNRNLLKKRIKDDWVCRNCIEFNVINLS